MAADITPGGYRRERFHAFRPRELVHLATRQPPHWVPDASDPAGETRFIPANTNYALAGMLVEQVTGHSWERETHERVIEPLGLRHTLTPGTCAYLPQPSATAYTRFPGAEALTDTSIIVPPGPDRGIISTTSDLNTFFRALLGGRLLSADRMAQMRETVEATAWARTWPGVRYGLGLAWRPLEGRDAGIWFHGGTMPGTVSQGGVSADGGRSVATLTSTYTFGTEQDAVDEAITTLVDRALSTPE
jgi:D-alanyl-D-alanine carboxypeptidase